MSRSKSVPFLKCHILQFTWQFFFPSWSLIWLLTFICAITGRKSYWKKNTYIAPARYLGSNFWSKESCLLKRRLNHNSPVCSSSENGSPFDPPAYSSLHFCVFPRLVLWCREWPRRWLLCKVYSLTRRFNFQSLFRFCLDLGFVKKFTKAVFGPIFC